MLLALPITDAIYDFRTDVRTDSATVDTAVGVTTGSMVLHTSVYDDDTDTIGIISDNPDDAPLFVSYNGTSRQTSFSGLSANDTRLVSVSYDYDALTETPAINAFVDNLARIFLILVFAFIPAALVAIFMGRAD